MAESLFASLLHTLDKGSISQIASALGESERNVSKGMEASIATVLGAATNKAEDPGALRNMLDLLPANAGDLSLPRMAAGLSSPMPSWINTGRQLVSGIFGSKDSAVAGALARDSGVSPTSAMSLLAMAAPIVLGGLSRRMREQAWSIRGLASALQRESPTIRGALPSGVADLLWPSAEAASVASPVVAQSVRRDRTSAAWVGALALALGALGSFWLWSHARRPIEPAAVTASGEASRLANDYVYRRLPSGAVLIAPADGLEVRLVDVINGKGDQTARLDCDRLTFDSRSATLSPASSAQLDNTAAILMSYPNVHLNLAGYSDTIGNPEQNLELAQERAESVKNQLVVRGISPDRLTTQGFGEATADNSMAPGRALNGRVSVQIIQR